MSKEKKYLIIGILIGVIVGFLVGNKFLGSKYLEYRNASTNSLLVSPNLQ